MGSELKRMKKDLSKMQDDALKAWARLNAAMNGLRARMDREESSDERDMEKGR